MKMIAATLAALVAASVIILPGGPARSAIDPVRDSCGTERWHVKTLDDAQSPYVHASILPTTVAQLRTTVAPADFKRDEDSKRYPGEFQDYALTVTIVGMKREADRDYHIVVADPGKPATMVVEIPDPACAASKASGYAPDYAAARKVIDACFGPPTARFRKAGGVTATIFGTLFFDADHGQTGRARLGTAKVDVELHPVRDVQISGGCSGNRKQSRG